VRKLITWLTLRTAAGELFDIDTALRPNGNSGLLVTSISTAFERYQARPRQQHRLDLGTPGADPRALCAGPRVWRRVRGHACAARCWPRLATTRRCARDAAMREKVRAPAR
jgi:glutamate-ammonia-ligase adenylyltransferase